MDATAYDPTGLALLDPHLAILRAARFEKM
jgi:hypothetical protein